MRGVESELHSGLVGVLSELGEQVADLLLAGVDDLAGGSLVNGLGDVATEALKLAVQLPQQVVCRQLGLGFHSCLRRKGGPTQSRAQQRAQA